MAQQKKTFGQMIREKRQALGLSQKELASQIKKEDGSSVSPQYQNDIEFDRRDPPSELMIKQYAKFLDFPVDSLFLAAGKVPKDVKAFATERPEEARNVFRAFRKNRGDDS